MECHNNACRNNSYNITLVHQKKDPNQVFVCGSGSEILCCDMNLSKKNLECVVNSMKPLEILKEGEQSVLVESEKKAELYVTVSGSKENVGIHKFGSKEVRPASHYKEQHYVGLISSRRKEDHLQDRVYAFYRQKNKETGLYSEMWIPFVTQVCMSDVGGPKNNLQFSWTSQMHARLFCGDPSTKRHFSELVDVATVHADRWQDTKVYALFRNQWGMSAVCVYTIEDIDTIFRTSPFKAPPGESKMDRPRKCVADSTTLSRDTLNSIEKLSEMEEWVWPMNGSGPVLVYHHNYTHIHVNSFQGKKSRQHTVMFLALHNGGIHKVLQNKSHAFIIADYQPWNHSTRLLDILLHFSSRKLYVSSRKELVQLDVANCGKFGATCTDCVLSRDPYCEWDGSKCIAAPDNTERHESTVNYEICLPKQSHRKGPGSENLVPTITIPPQFKYFLSCPVSSHHARYRWLHGGNSTACSSREEECVLLIHSMGPEHVGTYTCESEEMGYTKMLVRYQLQMKSRAVSHLSGSVVWVCLMSTLIKYLFC
ncbi:semaphorin-7A isoform 2-T2 [Pholidichthys leucotaenia]